MTDPRMDIVNEHLRLENAYDFPGCIAVFGRPRYEVMAGSELFEGAEQVHAFLAENHRAFPDFQFVPVRILPSTSAVIVEGRFAGTHLGSWRGLPATGRKIDFAMCLIFDFDGESLVSERLYFDQSAPLRQLGVADDPNRVRGKATMVITHPLVILRALLRMVNAHRATSRAPTEG